MQYFTGETYFQTEAPMDSSSLTRWRKRIGEEGVETLLMVTIDAARKIGLMKTSKSGSGSCSLYSAIGQSRTVRQPHKPVVQQEFTEATHVER